MFFVIQSVVEYWTFFGEACPRHYVAGSREFARVYQILADDAWQWGRTERGLPIEIKTGATYGFLPALLFILPSNILNEISETDSTNS